MTPKYKVMSFENGMYHANCLLPEDLKDAFEVSEIDDDSADQCDECFGLLLEAPNQDDDPIDKIDED